MLLVELRSLQVPLTVGGGEVVVQGGDVTQVLLSPQLLSLLGLEGVRATQPPRVLLQELGAPIDHVLVRVQELCRPAVI